MTTNKTMKLQRECDAFNAQHQVGTVVDVMLDGAEAPMRTKTRSQAEVLSGHSAVIWVEGVVGCYLLDRVSPAIASV